MKSFAEVYQIVEESSHETAYGKAECQALYDLALTFPKESIVVEIGVQWGRSTSVFAACALMRQFQFIAVDSWGDQLGKEEEAHVRSQMHKYGWGTQMTLLSMPSSDAAQRLAMAQLQAVHIDGDHSYEGVMADCNLWLNKVNPGGYALFDDYGSVDLTGVQAAATAYMHEHREWTLLEVVGHKLAIYQKEKV